MYQQMKYNIITPKPLNFGNFNLKQANKKVPKKDKSLPYSQAKNKYNLTPWGDADKDGITNVWDCQPLNPNKKGKIHEVTRKIKSKITGKKYGREERKYQRVKPQEGGIKETAYDIRETLGEVGKGAVKVAKKFGKEVVKPPLERITRPPEELQGKNLGEQIGEITKDAGIRNREENYAEFKRSLRPQLPTRRPTPELRVIREPGRSGMPPQPQGWWRGTPQQPTQQPPAEYQQLPEGMTEEEMMAIQQYQQQPPRKLPPLITRPDGTVVRVQEYQPVSKQQSFLNYRPVTYRPTGREYSVGNQSTRPQGIIPIAKFKFATFGRRIRE